MGSGPWLTAWLRREIERCGFETVAALRPEDLEPGSMHRAALIDLCLPDLMGWTLLETVAAEVPTAVILGPDPDEAQRALELGAKAFLKRPIDPARVVATLRFLERPSQRGSGSIMDELTGLPQDIVAPSGR
jgi:DNA-binding response OmpR family regulator